MEHSPAGLRGEKGNPARSYGIKHYPANSPIYSNSDHIRVLGKGKGEAVGIIVIYCLNVPSGLGSSVLVIGGFTGGVGMQK